MNFPDWIQARQDLIAKFNGESLHPATEDTIANAYELNATAVLRIADEVAAELNARAISSGFGILRHRTAYITNPTRNVIVTEADQRARHVKRAQTYMRNTGCLYDTPDEALADIFQDRDMLREWEDDQQLRREMRQLYHELQPRREKVERDQADYDKHLEQQAQHYLERRRQLTNAQTEVLARQALADTIAESQTQELANDGATLEQEAVL